LSRNKAKRVTLDEVADAVGISKYHLVHQFKLYTQKSMMTVLMQMRLEEAWRMLRKGASISETATACGFESLPYFSTSFKKRFGITPTQCIENKAAQYHLPGNMGIGQ
jgi:AraC-like DNA-binding protein